MRPTGDRRRRRCPCARRRTARRSCCGPGEPRSGHRAARGDDIAVAQDDVGPVRLGGIADVVPESLLGVDHRLRDPGWRISSREKSDRRQSARGSARRTWPRDRGPPRGPRSEPRWWRSDPCGRDGGAWHHEFDVLDAQVFVPQAGLERGEGLVASGPVSISVAALRRAARCSPSRCAAEVLGSNDLLHVTAGSAVGVGRPETEPSSVCHNSGLVVERFADGSTECPP